jgi:putative FmdB family regulatory protein
MPLYEYQCEACGHRFEKIQKFSDPLVDTCPVCSGAVRKLMSSPAIQFKGSGFYITDYPKKDQAGGEKSDGGSSEKTDKAAKPDTGAGKTGKTDKTDKADKPAAPAASDKGASSKPAASSSDSGSSSSTKPSS